MLSKKFCLPRAKAGLENKEAANAQRLRELEGQKGQFAGQIESLEADVLRLNKHADDLERQAHAARQEANTAGARLKELRSFFLAFTDELQVLDGDILVPMTVL